MLNSFYSIFLNACLLVFLIVVYSKVRVAATPAVIFGSAVLILCLGSLQFLNVLTGVKFLQACWQNKLQSKAKLPKSLNRHATSKLWHGKKTTI